MLRTAISTILLLLLGSPATAETLAIVGGTVIDGTGGQPLEKGVVVIEDGRIQAVGYVYDTPIPDGAKRIDAREAYVIPGLMDANLHLFLNIDTETLVKFEGRYDEIIVEAAQIALAGGLTTVFDTWGPRAALVEARDAIASGAVPGSRIYLAGNIIGFDGPLSADFRGAAAPHLSKAFVKRINDTWQEGTGRDLMWLGPEAVRNVVSDYTTTGVDFLKYGASGHVDMAFIVFSPRVQRAIVEAGHAANMTVQTHTTSIESLDMAIDAGVDIITHCDITGPTTATPQETIQKLVERKIPCSILPITQKRHDTLQELDPTSPMAALAPYMKIGRENQRNMIEAGVTLLMSTDAGIEHPVLASEVPDQRANTDPRSKLGEGHFNALVGLEELGMEPMEILLSATSHVARAYRMHEELGTLEPGKIGDLVILEDNPLESAKSYRSIRTVIHAGNVVDRDNLPASPIISSIPVPTMEEEVEKAEGSQPSDAPPQTKNQ